MSPLPGYWITEVREAGSMDDTMQVKCEAAGHEGEAVQFKKTGWKFKHLRLWQEGLQRDALSLSEMVALVTERIERWNLKDESGTVIEFKPGPEALDELDPVVQGWLMGTAYRDAYFLAVSQTTKT